MSRIAFVCGLHLDTDTGLVYISYGAADAYARLLTLHVSVCGAICRHAGSYDDTHVQAAGSAESE